MGCAQSSSGSRANDWNEAYEKAITKRDEALTRHATRSRSNRNLAERESLARKSSMTLIEKKEGQLKSVSGYAVGKQLGKGAFGEVFLATKGSEKYAIKVLHKKMLKSKRQGKHGSAFDGVKSEIATMRKMQHPNLVHMYDVIIDLEVRRSLRPHPNEPCLLLDPRRPHPPSLCPAGRPTPLAPSRARRIAG